MAIRTQESLSGFIASDPQLTYTERGDTRFYARFGQENFQREEDGSFTKLEPSFGNLVLYRATAERAFERFTKGDQFVAEGYRPRLHLRTRRTVHRGRRVRRQEDQPRHRPHPLRRRPHTPPRHEPRLLGAGL